MICEGLKNTSWFVATQYAKWQIAAKKNPSQSQLCSHREYAISACCFLRLSIVVLNTRVWFSIPVGLSCLFFSLYFPPEPWVQVSCHGRGWERNRQRQRWTARAISLWNIYGSLVLWLHGFWQWWHVNVNRRSLMQPLCRALNSHAFIHCVAFIPLFIHALLISVCLALQQKRFWPLSSVSSFPTQDQI